MIDFERLLAVLSPEVVLRADALAVHMAAANQRGAPKLAPEVRGARPVADAFKGRARGAVPAIGGGEPGAVWAANGKVRAVFVFSIRQDKIHALDLIMDPASIAELAVEIG